MCDLRPTIILFAIPMLYALLLPQSVDGQVQDARWSEPHRLSSEAGEAGEAVVVADQYGFMHAFWAETGHPDQHSIIRHARFDGDAWSDSIDLRVTQPGISNKSVTAAIDPSGVLHLVWTEGNAGPTYYSRVPAHEARSKGSWTPPRTLDVPAYLVKLGVDSKGVLHLLYCRFYDRTTGVYYMRSTDAGATWSHPERLDPDSPADHAPVEIQLALDGSDGLHALWHYFQRPQGGGPVLYVRSLDGGAQWSSPFLIDEPSVESGNLAMAVPGLIATGASVHVIWAAGSSKQQRRHRFSEDFGKSWSDPSEIFGKLHGQAMGDGLAVDGMGRVHFTGQIRWPQGLYHAVWDGAEWGEPSLFYLIAETHLDPRGERIHAHRVRLHTGGGNRLAVTFTTSPTDPQSILYAMRRTLDDVPSSPLLPTPSPAPWTATPTSTPVLPTPFVETPRIDRAAPVWAGDAVVRGLLWGLIPALVLVLGTLLFQLLRKR